MLRNEFGGSEAAEQPQLPTAGEVSWDFLLAIDRRDAKATAALTDDSEAARKTLGTVFKELPDAKVATTRHEDKAVDGARPTVGFDVVWTLGEGKTWSYENSMDLTKQDGRWRVNWTPKLIHPKLRAGQHLALLNGAAGKPAVLDADGKALLKWDESGIRVARPAGAQPLLPAMARYASEQGSGDSWGVAAVDADGRRKKLLHWQGT